MAEKDFVKLSNLKKMLLSYCENGYCIKKLREVLNCHVQKGRYKNFMMGCLRISVRLIEKYIREKCRKG